MRALRYAALAAAAFTGVSVAQAATVVATNTLDLSYVKLEPSGFIGTQGKPGFDADQNFSLSPGDVFDYTIMFQPSQTLTLNKPTLAWAYVYADAVAHAVGTGTFSFLDSTGASILTSNLRTDEEGDVHFGQYFDGSDFVGGLPTTITFSGVHYVGTLDAYLDPATGLPSLTTRNYSTPALFFTADSFSATGVAAAVPEPATWAMMIAGFALAGAAVRRRGAVKTAVSYS